jgi:hypothetical protein
LCTYGGGEPVRSANDQHGGDPTWLDEIMDRALRERNRSAPSAAAMTTAFMRRLLRLAEAVA